MATIKVSTWGISGIGDISVRTNDDDCSVTETVGRSIERRTGLKMLTCSSQGTSLSNGKPESRHYQAALGRPCRGGGSSVEGEIWFAIPCRSAR